MKWRPPACARCGSYTDVTYIVGQLTCWWCRRNRRFPYLRDRTLCVVCGAHAALGPVEPMLVDARVDGYGHTVSLCATHDPYIRKPK